MSINCLIPKNSRDVLRKKILAGYVFEDGEDTREVGERLAGIVCEFLYWQSALCLCRSSAVEMPKRQMLPADRFIAKSLQRREIVPILCKGDHRRRRQYPLHHAADTGTWLTDFLFSHALFQRCDNRVSETSLILKSDRKRDSTV